ncbi:carbon-nitrogen hydrolase family protein [Egicoccus sp. AB-alg2]|uniref:carbon-nitrogen hydrolase family protein n=1 Tax=Egicoccus sp. AB-alg2 TaxID=3242693 RepID=UPI00359EF16A
MSASNRVTVAAVQAAPVFMDRAATVEKTAALVDEAAARGARLIVFPESFVPGFPYWPRAYPLPERGRSLDALAYLRAGAVDLARDELGPVREAAARNDAMVVLGVTERGGPGDLLHNSLVHIDVQGQVVHVHRKLQATFDERCVWSDGDATGLAVHDSPAGRLGGLICGNNSMTLAKAALLLAGEQVHCAVWPGYDWMFPNAEIVCRGYAVEGRCFVVVAASFLPEAHVPDDFPLRDDTSWRIDGGSGVIGPDGSWLGGPLLGEEGIVTAEVELDQLERQRAVRDAVDAYGRPDLFRLLVNVAPQRLRGEPAERVLGAEWRVYS